MLLIAYLSKIFHSIMFAVVFQYSKFWVIFPCHQLINKGVAPLNYFCYLLNLSFLDFLIEYFLIFSVIWTICFFSCLSDIEFFIGRRLNYDILRFFRCGLKIDNFLLGLRFDNFLHFIRLDFSINCRKLSIFKESICLVLNKREYGRKKLIFVFEKSKENESEVFTVNINDRINQIVDIFLLKRWWNFLKSCELS